MDPSYQQAMIQALMGGQSLAPGMGGQNATTPYGQGFITGNQMMPTANPMANQAAQQAAGSGQTALNSSGSTQLMQPTSTFTS